MDTGRCRWKHRAATDYTSIAEGGFSGGRLSVEQGDFVAAALQRNSATDTNNTRTNYRNTVIQEKDVRDNILLC